MACAGKSHWLDSSGQVVSAWLGVSRLVVWFVRGWTVAPGREGTAKVGSSRGLERSWGGMSQGQGLEWHVTRVDAACSVTREGVGWVRPVSSAWSVPEDRRGLA